LTIRLDGTTLTVGTLGTSTITASTPQNLFLLQNYTSGSKIMTINDTIGSIGSVITVQNKGTGGPTCCKSQRSGRPKCRIVQNSSASFLELSAANTYAAAQP